MSSEEIRAVLHRLKASLAQLYGPRLGAVHLSGSVARSEADSQSNIDVLIVLDRVEDYSGQIQRTSDLIGRLSLECGRSISQVFLPEQKWREDENMCAACAGRGGGGVKEEARKLLEKAERALRAAESLLREGLDDIAAGRAYYTTLQTAQALLRDKDLHYRWHGSVHAAYGEHFAKTGLMDPKFHRWPLDAFDERLLGDYGMPAWIRGRPHCVSNRLGSF